MPDYAYTRSTSYLPEQLIGEILTINPTSISGISTSGTDITVHSGVSLTLSEQASVETAISSHVPNTAQAYVSSVIKNAIQFGNQLLINYAAENVLLGITMEGKTGQVLTKLASVQLALQAGSLYEAIIRIRAIPTSEYDAKYLTADRLLAFINKIETYLGLALSETL